MNETPRSSASERQERARICGTCASRPGCDSASKPALAETACPQSLWPDRMRGAGDIVAAVAQPVARVIDGAFGTDLANCSGCQDRRDWLNKKLPFPSR
jgi:hypothetical protein